MDSSRTQQMEASERSGVLHPDNVERFSAQWIEPAAQARDVIDTYWSVQWRLGDGEVIDQRIIDHPSVTLSIEHGDVLAPFVVSAVRAQAWRREIRGSGDVFALRLRPAGLAVLTDFAPAALTGERAITRADGRVHGFLEVIEHAPDAPSRARAADLLICDLLQHRPFTELQHLANAAVDLLTAEPIVRPVSEIASALNTSSRSLQRALQRTIGRGPAEVARRFRLQEVVRRLSDERSTIARIASDLGYTDQAHLTNEFRAVTGTTPGGYLTEK